MCHVECRLGVTLHLLQLRGCSRKLPLLTYSNNLVKGSTIICFFDKQKRLINNDLKNINSGTEWLIRPVFNCKLFVLQESSEELTV